MLNAKEIIVLHENSIISIEKLGELSYFQTEKGNWLRNLLIEKMIS